AWRMFNLVRNQLMTQDETQLSGEVEADETFVGGKPRLADRRRRDELAGSDLTRGRMQAWDKRAVVFGAVERRGRIRAVVVPNSRARTLNAKVQEFIVPKSILFTDDYLGYRRMGKGYIHRRINHSARIYVDGNVHTQTIEGFFGL